MDAELALLRQKEQYAAQVHEAELAFWRREEENAAQLHQKNQIKYSSKRFVVILNLFRIVLKKSSI